MRKKVGLFFVVGLFVLMGCKRSSGPEPAGSANDIHIEETTGVGIGFESSFFPLRFLKL